MSLVSSTQKFSWNWVDNNGNLDLVVGGAVYDVTIPTAPVLVTIVQMTGTGNGAYSGSFQGLQGKNYSVQSSVYIDNTWAVVNPVFPPGAEDFQCASVSSSGGGGGGGCEIVGFITNNNLIGLIQPSPTLVGLVEC
jgi:hypothetical protein